MLVSSAPARVAITAALPSLALLACQLLRTWLEPTYDPLFIASTALITWLCGARYGFVSALLSALALDYFFLPPYNSLELLDSNLQVKFFLFLSANSIIIGLIHYAHGTRVALAESELRYRNLGELIPFGGWLADERGNMIRLSESFLKTLGATMQECKGLGWMKLLDENDREQVLADWRECMRSGYFWDYEYRLRSKSGGSFVVLSRGVPVESRHGKRRTWVGIHLDITQREHDAQQRIDQARDIARFNAELEQLAYVSAHDLQEPLRMIASYLQLLSRRYAGKLDADADCFINYAVEGAERLQSLLQDLLQLQQVGKAGRPRTALSLATLVDRACDGLRNEITRLNAEIICGDLPVIECDEPAFLQLFTNLIDNALKYHREGVPPRIRISAQLSGNLWEVSIQDNGIGIEAEFINKIFNVFQRLHPRSMYPGTGIGLAICKKIVEMHGGHLTVESAPGEGSTFSFTIPVSQKRAA